MPNVQRPEVIESLNIRRAERDYCARPVKSLLEEYSSLKVVITLGALP